MKYLFAGAFVALSLMISSCSSTETQKSPEASQAAKKVAPVAKSKPDGPYVNKFAKSLQPLLVDINGKSVDAASFNGKKYTLLYFSAAWCGPCQRFLPTLVKSYNELKSPICETVLVSADHSDKAMYGYMKKKQMPWLALPPAKRKESGLRQFSQRGIPCLALIDDQGKAIFKGYVKILPQIEAFLKQEAAKK